MGEAASESDLRRTRHRRPLNSAVILLVICLGVAGWSLGSLGQAAAAVTPPPGGGGGCPTPYSIDLTASVTSTGTSATITFGSTSSSPLSSGGATISWGTSTSYGYTTASLPFNYYTSSPGSEFLNYLKPSTTYDYKISASGSCGSDHYTGTYTGSWSTGSDSITTITGTVSDENGAVDSAGGLYVLASCADIPSGYSSSAVNSVTTTTGTYSFSTMPGYASGGVVVRCTSGPFLVQVVNQPTQYYVGITGYLSTQWQNHWNESIVIFAPQTVNFQLAVGANTVWVPEVYIFNSAGYAEVTYSQSVTYQTSETSSLAGNGITSAESTTESSGYSPGSGASIEFQEEYQSTGDVRIDMTGNRTPWIDESQFWGHELETSLSLSPSNWVSLSSLSCVQLFVCDAWVEAGTGPNSHDMTVGGSISHVTGFEGDIGVSFAVPTGDGTNAGPSLSIPVEFTNTASSSGTEQVAVTFDVPSTATYSWYEFDVYCDGGTTSGQGIVPMVWQVGESDSAPT